MNEKQAAVHAALSVHQFTPAFQFVPRIVGVERDEIHSILVELQGMGLAELAYGQGWRAIPGPNTRINPDDQKLYHEWQIEVSEFRTILGYPEWVMQKAIAAGAFDEDKK